MPPAYSALIDSRTYALLALSSQISTIVFLKEITADTIHVPGVNYPSYTKSFPLATESPDKYPQWTWVFASRTFAKTKRELLNDELKNRSLLSVQKRDVVNEFTRHLSITRYPLWTGILFQETAYLAKKLEAQRFRDSGYADERITDYPFLISYADYARLSPRQAADDIIFKAKLGDDLLAKTELLRIKYFNKVKEATDPATLPTILSAFLKECYGVAIQ